MDDTITTENTKTNTWRYISIALILANTLLIISLISSRAARARLQNIPFMTPTFVLIMVVAFFVFIISIWSLRNGRLKTLIHNRLALFAAGFSTGGFIALILLPQLIPDSQPYIPSLMLWWAIITIGFAPALLSQYIAVDRLQKIATDSVPVIISLIVCFVFAEIGLRVWFTSFGTEAERVAYIYSLDDILAQRNRFTGASYINYGLNPQHPDHNSRGYRGQELIQSGEDERFRIFAIGGSTTYGISLQNDETYPIALQNLLKPDYPQLEVINAGVPQYASPDSLANFTYRILDDKPDMLIIYHAVNDVVIRLVDPAAYNGANPARGIWQRNINVPSSTVWRFIGISLGLVNNPGLLDSLLFTGIDTCADPTYCENLQMTPQELLDANPPIYFERNLRNIIALAQANDVEVVLSTWAYFPDAVNNFEYMVRPHMQAGVAEHNEIIRQLADELNLPLIDLANTMPVNADFWLDGLHMTPAGTREQAEQYAVFLIENNLLPDPENP